MIDISIIIPVYNRPEEVGALLYSLTNQTDSAFEVVIVEDGSDVDCKEIVAAYRQQLDLAYYSKKNSGPGLSRNYGAEKAKGNYFIFFDSDCEIPPEYVQTVRKKLTEHYTDAFGGPDRADASFTPTQKAINYSMTSFFTTGGIRGQKTSMEKFHPRSFNMGISKEAFEKTGGFSPMRFGEDIDLSIRLFEAGLSVQLIEAAYVYHKRRTDFRKFFKQVYNSGIARINLYKLHPASLKAVHFLPSAFLIGTVVLLFMSFFNLVFLSPVLILAMLLFADALVKNKKLAIAWLSVVASFIQLSGYGAGFIAGVWNRLILGKEDFQAFSETFYK